MSAAFNAPSRDVHDGSVHRQDFVAGGNVEGRDTFGGSIFARDGAGAGTSRTLTARDLLAGSAFRFTSEGCGADARWTLWGRGAWSGFSGRDDDLSLDGDVATGVVGADFGRDDWLGGLMLSHGEGSRTYTTDGSVASGRSEGEFDSSLTGLYPYLGLDLTERMSVWEDFTLSIRPGRRAPARASTPASSRATSSSRT